MKTINTSRTTTRWLATAALLAASLSSAWGNTPALSANAPAVSGGTVIHVVDGDTFDVSLSDRDTYERLSALASTEDRHKRLRHLDDRQQSIRVRLANVDTEESKHHDASRNTDAGRHIATIMKMALEGQPVFAQCYDWGSYGRLICTLGMGSEGENGDVGYALIRDGYSEYVTYWGENPFYHNAYQEAGNDRD
jgi:endonuclease YncB( thermonuclease family)